MGNKSSKVSFHCHCESPGGSGLKSIVSDPIDDMSPDMFWALLETFIRMGPDPKPKTVLDYDAAELQDGSFAITTTLCASPVTTFTKIILHADGADAFFYGNDASLTNLQATQFYRSHHQPFRLEAWALWGSRRDSGEAVAALLQAILLDLGHNVELYPSVGSLSEPGQRSVVSEPMAGVTPQLFWHLFEVYCRTRPPKEHESEVRVSELEGGGLLQAVTTARTSLVNYATATLRPNECEFVAHLMDETRVHVAWRDFVWVHHDPFRLELWCQAPAKVFSGRFLRDHTAKVLKAMGYPVGVDADADSLYRPGEKCVLSAPLGQGLSAEAFLSQVRQFLRSQGASDEPDGSMYRECNDWFAPTRYCKTSFHPAALEVVQADYFGPALSQEELWYTIWWRLHKDPLRVEGHMVTCEKRLADEGTKARIGQWLVPIIDRAFMRS